MRFDHDHYRATAAASPADLKERWQQVTREMVGGLLFALGAMLQTFADRVTW
jgi:hypothetical protein